MKGRKISPPHVKTNFTIIKESIIFLEVIEENEMEYEKKYKSFSCIVKYKDVYFAVSDSNNAFYILDENCRTIKETIVLEQENIQKENLFSQGVVIYDETLVLIPECAKHLVLYNLISGEICYIDVPDNFMTMAGCIDGCIYMMACKTGIFYQFNFDQKSIVKIDNANRKIQIERLKKPLSDLIFRTGLLIQEKVVYPYRWYPKAYIFDMCERKGYVLDIEGSCGFVDLVFEREMYYFLCEDGRIIKTDRQFRNAERIEFHTKHIQRLRYPYRFICVRDQQILLFPMYYTNITMIDLRNETYQDITCSDSFHKPGKYNICKNFCVENKNQIVILPSLYTDGFAFDLEKDKAIPFLQIKDEEASLESYLRRKYVVNMLENHADNVGEKIWKIINK